MRSLSLNKFLTLFIIFPKTRLTKSIFGLKSTALKSSAQPVKVKRSHEQMNLKWSLCKLDIYCTRSVVPVVSAVEFLTNRVNVA